MFRWSKKKKSLYPLQLSYPLKASDGNSETSSQADSAFKLDDGTPPRDLRDRSSCFLFSPARQGVTHNVSVPKPRVKPADLGSGACNATEVPVPRVRGKTEKCLAGSGGGGGIDRKVDRRPIQSGCGMRGSGSLLRQHRRLRCVLRAGKSVLQTQQSNVTSGSNL